MLDVTRSAGLARQHVNLDTRAGSRKLDARAWVHKSADRRTRGSPPARVPGQRIDRLATGMDVAAHAEAADLSAMPMCQRTCSRSDRSLGPSCSLTHSGRMTLQASTCPGAGMSELAIVKSSFGQHPASVMTTQHQSVGPLHTMMVL
ncbi:hypothetical protein L1887_61399 [Cichorium endivia]|nr:hypothetical protein L1887_61399 [Cichorium endivia]